MSYSNQKPFEGTVTTEATLDFGFRVALLMIQNDSSTKTLQFKFHSSESFSSLKPTEQMVVKARISEIIIQGLADASVKYRIWGYY